MVIGFTATRHVRGESDEAVIDRVLLDLWSEGIRDIVTGGCYGGDAVIAAAAKARGFRVHTVLPAVMAQVDGRWKEHCTTWEQTAMTAEPYRTRNERIVALADRLVAFPERAEDDPRSRRSGTWMTVRIARRAGKPVDIHILG